MCLKPEKCLMAFRYNTRSCNGLIPPAHLTAAFRMSFYFNGFRFFNNLNASIKSAPTASVFQKKTEGFSFCQGLLWDLQMIFSHSVYWGQIPYIYFFGIALVLMI